MALNEIEAVRALLSRRPLHGRSEQKNPVTIVFDERRVAVLDILRDSKARRPASEVIGPTPPLALVLRTQPLVVEGYLLSRGSLLRRIPELPDITALRLRHAGALAGPVGKNHDILRHVCPLDISYYWSEWRERDGPINSRLLIRSPRRRGRAGRLEPLDQVLLLF